jgi:type IV secretion system protein TrbG
VTHDFSASHQCSDRWVIVTDDDSSTPKTAPRPVQRLDVPEALLTAEWNVADLPWLEPAETSDSSSAQQSESAVPPPPPSRRRAQVAAAARTGEAGPQQPTTLLPSRQQGVTVPRPQRPVHAAPAIVINDPGATLPPRDQRVADQGPPPGTSDSVATSVRLGPGRPSFVALGAALGCAIGYALWTGVLRPSVADAAPTGELPQFLRETSATVDVTAVPAVTSPSPPPSTLPPSLAATLAEALPPATSEAASLAGDAGAPPLSSALLEDPPLQSTQPKPVSADTQRRAAALRAVMEAQRANTPDSKSETHSPSVSDPASAPAPELVTKWPNDPDAPPRIRRRRHNPPPPAEPLRPPPATAAIRPLTTYTYEDKALFAVATAPMRVTDLALEPGETLVSQPTAGDAARWVITVVQGQAQTHVFVKPLRSRLRTNLTLTTNRRSYFLELSCRDDGTYMAGVAWQYPADDSARRREVLARAERERQSTTAVSDLQALRFDYRIVAAGDAPSWKPIMVFDDGAKTFIRFPGPIAAPHAPVLFIPRSGTTRDAKYVNYRVKGDLYVLDRLIDAAELRLPSDNDGQDIVRITRKH